MEQNGGSQTGAMGVVSAIRAVVELAVALAVLAILALYLWSLFHPAVAPRARETTAVMIHLVSFKYIAGEGGLLHPLFHIGLGR